MLIASACLGASIAAPSPDEYQIPAVGNNRRSQYSVLHADGSFKYGFDTGEDAFESKKQRSDGEGKGEFGYRNPDGDDVRVEYTSGTGGFVAKGSHIPEEHPDVVAAFAAARAKGPFVDPLADTEGDRSYDFNFAGANHSRSEVSNSDGTVTGSYSYVDEFGRLRSYTYRAGKGIGFVIEGDDIPQQVQPLPVQPLTAPTGHSATRTSTRTSHASTRAHSSATPSRSTFTSHSTTRSNTGRTGSSRTRVIRPTKTYFSPPSQPSSASQSVRQSHNAHSAGTSSTRFTSSGSSKEYEEANTRTSFSPSGSYSLAYETSSHTRAESGDDENNVEGSFTFTADDNGEHHDLRYEAGRATGFVASGAHLPVGPSVPGAASGQVTGRLEKQPHFEDPLAEDLDASYNFKFGSDSYSRTEVADEEGNISGTYSVLGEDNILRTYRFRAGKGIGYEVEEISAVPGKAGASTSASSKATSASSGRTRTTSSTGGFSSSVRHGGQASSGGSSHKSSISSSTGSTGGSHFSGSTSHRQASTTKTHGGASSSNQVFDGFSLRQYDATEGRGKYGYVLKFD